MDTEQTVDLYAGFNHKFGRSAESLPSWMDDETKRRIEHYRIADALRRQVSRVTLPSDSPKRTDYRELGEAGMLAERRASAVIGDGVILRVPGADERLPDEPILPDEPEEPELEGVDRAIARVRTRKYRAMLESYESLAETRISEWETAHLEQPLLRARQEALRNWADEQRLEAKLREMQGELVQPLGEAIVTLASVAGAWPDITVWEPDAYHPVFAGELLSEFPGKTHLAYEFDDVDDNGRGKRMIRRVTWELVTLVDPESGEPQTSDLAYRDEPTSTTCVYTDAYFEKDNRTTARVVHLDDLQRVARFGKYINEEGAEVDADRVDLGVDFIPVVHVPRKLLSLTHFAPSMFVDAAQLLDTIAENDTDASRASGFTGAPPLVAKDVRLGTKDPDGVIRYRPGVIFQGGKDASVSKVDMGDSLGKLDEHGELLRDRLYAVLASPKALIGRESENNRDESGVARETAFTPFVQTIRDARLAADAKHRLLLKFAQRMAIVSGAPDVADDSRVYDAEVELGSFMPNDVAHVIEQIVALAQSGLMVPELAFRWLTQVGVDVGDADLLIKALKSSDFDGAEALAAMLGRKYAARYLGIPFDEDDPDLEDDGDVDPDAPPGLPAVVLNNTGGVGS